MLNFKFRRKGFNKKLVSVTQFAFDGALEDYATFLIT